MQPKKGDLADRAMGYALSFLAGMGFVSAVISYHVYNWGT